MMFRLYASLTGLITFLYVGMSTWPFGDPWSLFYWKGLCISSLHYYVGGPIDVADLL